MTLPTIVILEDSIERIKLFNRKLINKANINTFDNVKKCEIFIKENSSKIDMIFLDHDLDDKVYVDSNDPNTGYSMAKIIKKIYGEEYPEIIIHSLNPAGADNIQSILPRSRKIPFTILINNI